MKMLLSAFLLMSASTANANVGPAELPGWMTGAWERVEGDKWSDEYWTPPKAGLMIGASRSGVGEKLVFWEHMRIMREDDGALAFWAISGDQQPVRFGLTKIASSEIIFENADHDYPQRVRYWRQGKELKAQISLLDGSKAVNFSFGLMGSD
jgi:hypothetical protein